MNLAKRLYLKEQKLDTNPSLSSFPLPSQVTEGVNYKPGPSVGCVKCIYSEGSWRCGEKSIPLSKYCAKHILHVSIGKEVVMILFTLLMIIVLF